MLTAEGPALVDPLHREQGLLAQLKRAGAFALQWRLLLAGWLGACLPAIAAVLPVWLALSAALDEAPAAAAWAEQFNPLMLADLGGELGPAVPVLGAGFGIAAALVLALNPLLHALAVCALRASAPLTWRPLLAGALAGYWRMARLLCVSLIPLALAAVVWAALAYAARRYAQTAVLEVYADAARWAARLLGLLAFVAARAGVEAGRAVLAADPARRSAFLAWWRGAMHLLSHPVQVLLPWLILALLGTLALGVLGLARVQLSGTGALPELAGLLVVQCGVLLATGLRLVRLALLVQRLPVVALPGVDPELLRAQLPESADGPVPAGTP
jgi:hypothetical protein